MSDEQDEALELIWDDLRVGRSRSAPAPEPGEDAADQVRALAEPGDLVIGTSRSRLLVVIKRDGSLEYGPDYSPDEASRIFWEAIGNQRFQYEERVLLFQHMEALLTRLGEADLRLESLRRRVADGDGLAGQQAGGALVALERLVHQAIELGRGLARRPDVPIPEIPTQIPERIRQNPQSAYVSIPGTTFEDAPSTPIDPPNQSREGIDDPQRENR